jgi:2-oxoglutarate ferredoxin oxidoreductase subunit alpha
MSVNGKVEIWDRKKMKGGSPFGTEEEDGVPPMPAFGEGERLLVTGSTHDEMGFRKTDAPEAHAKLVKRINKKILNYRSLISRTEGFFIDDSEIFLITYGFTARTSLFVVKQLRKEGKKVGLLRLKTLWPFPEEAVAEVVKKAKKVMVPEMNQGQVVGEIRKLCQSDVIPLNQTDGEVIRPETIMDCLRKIA